MSKKKILIIDDESAFTRIVKLNLEKTGKFIVQEENRGRRATVAAREFKPDLILLDVLMPDVDGGEVAALLRSDPKLKDIPIIFLTATVSKRESGSVGARRGGLLFIGKPVSTEELIECIEKHFIEEKPTSGQDIQGIQPTESTP